jgi:hypothetical protein
MISGAIATPIGSLIAVGMAPEELEFSREPVSSLKAP